MGLRVALGIFWRGGRKFEVCTVQRTACLLISLSKAWSGRKEGAGRGTLGVILAVIASM